ncbi:hypothetical protein SDC9_114183 [bioreactor metagenome]|uniref:Uncharacterized protein n=1 Tax=bioreactor metagenome TaxID=1076179 RepID=A0A645BRL8_9ZZZZ
MRKPAPLLLLLLILKLLPASALIETFPVAASYLATSEPTIEFMVARTSLKVFVDGSIGIFVVPEPVLTSRLNDPTIPNLELSDALEYSALDNPSDSVLTIPFSVTEFIFNLSKINSNPAASLPVKSTFAAAPVLLL